MLDVVKFTWRNTHGYWIPAAWLLVISGQTEIRPLAVIGRPGLTDIRELDRATIPEELRLTGHSRLLLSQVVLFDKDADNYTAQEMVEAMVVQTA